MVCISEGSLEIIFLINDSQLAKLKKSIPDMSLS